MNFKYPTITTKDINFDALEAAIKSGSERDVAVSKAEERSMDFQIGEPSAEELGHEDGMVVRFDCQECGNPLWTDLRNGVPTEVKCFRDHCAMITVITVTAKLSKESALLALREGK